MAAIAALSRGFYLESAMELVEFPNAPSELLGGSMEALQIGNRGTHLGSPS